MSNINIANLLSNWFESQKRDLPWRKKATPYQIWISEVMLQQTQVNTVLPYFQRWMKKYPDIYSLAKAPLEEVLKLWEGLGYYSRARNLHAGAQQVVNDFQGVLPNTIEDLKKIKGIGPYTLGAILNFAYHQRYPFYDGNIKRVISRLFELQGQFKSSKDQERLNKKISQLLLGDTPWTVTEALMELGAMICKPKSPACALCPIPKFCKSYQNQTQHLYPYPTPRKKTIYLHRLVFVIEFENQLLIQKQSQRLMKDLYQFPFIERSKELEVKQAKNFLDKHLLSFEHANLKPRPIVQHGFTHHRATLYPFHVVLSTKNNLKGYDWFAKEDIKALPFSSGHKKILKSLI